VVLPAATGRRGLATPDGIDIIRAGTASEAIEVALG
jgi:hypothetical protein